MAEQRSFTDRERKELQQPNASDREAWQSLYRTWAKQSGQRSEEMECVIRFMAWRAAHPAGRDARIYSHDEILRGIYLQETAAPAVPAGRSDYDDSDEALAEARDPYSDV
jgi:hypothetical protein